MLNNNSLQVTSPEPTSKINYHRIKGIMSALDLLDADVGVMASNPAVVFGNIAMNGDEYVRCNRCGYGGCDVRVQGCGCTLHTVRTFCDETLVGIFTLMAVEQWNQCRNYHRAVACLVSGCAVFYNVMQFYMIPEPSDRGLQTDI